MKGYSILIVLIVLISLTLCNSIINNKNSIVKSTTSTTKHSIIKNTNTHNNNDISLSKYDKSLSKVLIVLLPLLYFISVSLNHVALPKVVNLAINNNIHVSQQSASTYGMLSGIDALFTFLSVNLIGILSDKYGRKKFMIYSCMGLALSFTVIINASSPIYFYIAAMIDGLSSVMFSQAQAYVADLDRVTNNNTNNSNNNNNIIKMKRVGESLSRFQGLSVGLGYVIGLLSGSLLMTKYTLLSPLYLGIGLLLLSSVLITAFLPETVQRQGKEIDYSEANPLGAMVLLTRNRNMLICSISYFFLNLSIAGIQGIWINYLDYKFKWGIVKNASTLVVQYSLISIMPRILNKLFGPSNTILCALLIHSISVLLLANAKTDTSIFLIMVFLAAGVSASPSLLGYLTDQVDESETGALQGSVDTIRTITIAISHPIISKIFANTMNVNVHGNQLNPFYLCSLFSFIAFSVYAIGRLKERYIRV
jgi:DHA1 family tetracycline resistance protein-like MFS transporter